MPDEERSISADVRAEDILRSAAKLIEQRGAARDQPNGERSMSRCVGAFNALRDRDLTEEEGWLFMVLLKYARAGGGCFTRDDYDDAVAYAALLAERVILDNLSCIKR